MKNSGAYQKSQKGAAIFVQKANYRKLKIFYYNYKLKTEQFIKLINGGI